MHSTPERHGLPAAVNILSELLERRHSCRAFLPTPVPPDVIRSMLALAQRTASWSNVQPWQVYIASGASKERLRTGLREAAISGKARSDVAFPTAYEGSHKDRRRASGLQLYAAARIEKGDREGATRQALLNFELFGAPHVLALASPKYLGAYGILDCGGWLANLLLAAEAHGVAAVPQGALATKSDILRSHFSIPQELDVLCGVSFGYKDPDAPVNSYRTARADLEETCVWSES